MTRNLTDEEKLSQEGDLLLNVGIALREAVNDGILKDCEIIDPFITDEGILDTINKMLETKAEYMYYIPVVGTDKNFIAEAKVIKQLIELLSENFDNTVFDDNKLLIHINSVSIKGNSEPKNVHNIIFLMKNFDGDVDDVEDEDEESNSSLIN